MITRPHNRMLNTEQFLANYTQPQWNWLLIIILHDSLYIYLPVYNHLCVQNIALDSFLEAISLQLITVLNQVDSFDCSQHQSSVALMYGILP